MSFALAATVARDELLMDPVRNIEAVILFVPIPWPALDNFDAGSRLG